MTKPRIMVVDDEPNAREALAELLRDEGFEIATASDGVDALAKLGEFAPEVVIADLHMPGITGSDLVMKLVQRPDRPSVVAVTAFGESADGVDALRAGAYDYLIKPINVDELLLVLGKVLAHHELEREVGRLRATRA